MRPSPKPELVPKGLKLEQLVANRHRVSIYLSSSAPCASCSVCGRHSGRVHSRYERTVADLPWHGVPVTLHVGVRRFFCDNLRCERAIFAERLEEVAAYARKTDRLQGALSFIGFALGGRAGTKLAKELGLLAGRDTGIPPLRRTRFSYAAVDSLILSFSKSAGLL